MRPTYFNYPGSLAFSQLGFIFTATWYFAAAVVELVLDAELSIWHLCIWHGRGFNLPRATNVHRPQTCQVYIPRHTASALSFPPQAKVLFLRFVSKLQSFTSFKVPMLYVFKLQSFKFYIFKVSKFRHVKVQQSHILQFVGHNIKKGAKVRHRHFLKIRFQLC